MEVVAILQLALKLFSGTATFSSATACRFFRLYALNVSRAVVGPALKLLAGTAAFSRATACGIFD
jgi:hypothetical protein